MTLRIYASSPKYEVLQPQVLRFLFIVSPYLKQEKRTSKKIRCILGQGTTTTSTKGLQVPETTNCRQDPRRFVPQNVSLLVLVP